jgi:sugar/nucleoside kinase (ribokinase family)
MALLAVGSIAFDDLETPAGARSDLLGGSATYFSLCASNFCPVRLVAVVGEDFGEEQEATYRGRPIDLGGVIRRKGKSFHWKGRYGHDLNEAQTLKTDLNVFADFAPDLPDHYRGSPYLFLGNIDPRLQMEVVRQMSPRPKWVALDTMNFWIDGSRGDLEKVLKAVDILLINEAEAKSLAGEANAVKAAAAIMSMGPRIVVVKRGEYGALLAAPGIRVPVPAMPMDAVTDPTGAGDTFAGGFLGFLASKGDMEEPTLRKAMYVGTVMASFTIESFGIERIASVTGGDIEERLRLFFRTTGIQDL